MRSKLLAVAASHGGVLTRAQALRVVPRHVVDDAVTSATLRSIHPGVYVVADRERDWWCRAAAALAYTAGALSHLDALHLWSVVPDLAERSRESPIHVTVPDTGRQVRARGLVVHRRASFDPQTPQCRSRDGLFTVSLEQALVDCWSLLAPDDRRTPIIVAVRERRTTAVRIHDVLTAQPAPPTGVAALRELLALVGEGCHSELELFGHARVLQALPPSRAQVPMSVRGRRIYLDRYFDAEMVNVELDGAAYHGSPGQRERDVARDAALAALGILVVRLTHQRLTRDPEGVRQDLLRILATRRGQLSGP